jgi:hypothetical protein
MATSADSIVTSHKEAAKRAAEYLHGARNLKLKPPEALELVARVMGVANWQTLLGMAKQGKAPHALWQQDAPVAEPTPEHDGGDDPVVSSILPGEAEEIMRFADYYASGGAGEHPRWTRQAWKSTETDRPYWEWAYYELIGAMGLLPWDADNMESCQLARAAGVTVDCTDNDNWLAQGTTRLYVEVYYAPDEARAWDHAGEAAYAYGVQQLGRRWLELSLADKMQFLKREL